jgi:hypothetical protein
MRGGRGRGQGRKKGSRNKRKEAELDRLAATGEMPIDYVLRIMRNPKTTKARADRMALIALPYTSQKLAPKLPENKPPIRGEAGKKAAARAAAGTAAEGTEWAELVEESDTPN